MKSQIKMFLAIAAILFCGVLVFQWNVTHFHLGYWLQVHTGTIQEAGPYYGFFSGFGSDLGEYVIVSSVGTAVIVALRKNNCHHDGCPWLGRYHIADGHYRVCRKHHPDAAVRAKHVDMEHIIHIHRKHLEAKGINPDC